MSLDEMASLINEKKPSGSLRIFGHWFGRPYDDCHQVLMAKNCGDFLELKLVDGFIRVWEPYNVTFEGRGLKIARASKIVHSWKPAYGAVCGRAYVVCNGKVELQSTVEYLTEINWKNEASLELLDSLL